VWVLHVHAAKLEQSKDKAKQNNTWQASFRPMRGTLLFTQETSCGPADEM
jgi:hypothetical protein